jgi:predicted transcriptional regulator
MDQVHVALHKVLVEGRTQRTVARELGLSRTTVGKYAGQAAPVRKAEAGSRSRSVWDKVVVRVAAVLADSVRWRAGNQRLTATRLHLLLRAEGHRVGATVIKTRSRSGSASAARSSCR